MPASLQEIPSVVQQIQRASSDMAMLEGPVDEDNRKQALSLAKGHVSSLEKPEDVVMRYAFEVWF